MSGLTWFTLWVNNCRTIEDGKLRRAAVYELGDTARNRSRWLKNLALWIIEEKADAPEKVVRQIGQLLLGFSTDQLLLLCLISPLVLIPPPVYQSLRRMRRTVRGKPYPRAEQPADFFRL